MISDSAMDMNSEKSGHSFKSRSFRSGTSTSMTSTTECQKLKKVMNKIRAAKKAIQHYEYQVKNPLPVDPNDGFKTLLKRKRQKRETLVRELQILPPCTDPDCPDHFSALAESTSSRKNSQSEKIKRNIRAKLKNVKEEEGLLSHEFLSSNIHCLGLLTEDQKSVESMVNEINALETIPNNPLHLIPFTYPVCSPSGGNEKKDKKLILLLSIAYMLLFFLLLETNSI
ncbi:hypothetical protein TNIN_474451 [Trichonephila inaurata madagascariensis]|uniref:Uncharacterized protein n=1 Tax=Trichonephila inaurata madagascariensis TaxID=2747483 RepID=A0A8X6XN62_9ARAC|nr:hypothetical protein TNIN_474451 [Trichonephila inaurata madagascariensis]